MTTIKTEFERLKSTLSFSDDKILLDFFDDLPVVDAEELLGKWRGGDFKTGHWGKRS
ncbi:GXWXG domain-containing protein [Photobacterium leiognathi]|uniref:GXWXG domain-containing protein n=1 Tax=Photobacterium leiognathi TaxID=553611 RepID=UPI003AF403C2